MEVDARQGIPRTVVMVAVIEGSPESRPPAAADVFPVVALTQVTTNEELAAAWHLWQPYRRILPPGVTLDEWVVSGRVWPYTHDPGDLRLTPAGQEVTAPSSEETPCPPADVPPAPTSAGPVPSQHRLR